MFKIDNVLAKLEAQRDSYLALADHASATYDNMQFNAMACAYQATLEAIEIIQAELDNDPIRKLFGV